MSKPILYSLQHCPYAMRARMALLMAKEPVILRAIVTKNKPPELRIISPKATVPILILPDGSLIDESLDIMIWALKKNDPENLLYCEKPEVFSQMLDLISVSDHEFRVNLSAYKNSKRYYLEDEIELRTKCEVFIKRLETLLQDQDYFMGEKLSIADLAILPFIRQFANVDKKWFRETDYPRLTLWLANRMQSLLFSKTMRKYPLWVDSQEEFLFSWDSKTNL